MDKIEKSIFAGLFLFLLGLVVLLAGGHESLFRKDHDKSDPFPEDRVATVRIVMAEKDWQWILSNPMAEQYVRADFWFDGRRYPNVAIRPKGNSSLMTIAGSGSKRMSLKIDFNFFNSAQTFYGLKKLCLNNGFSDPTYIREILGYELFEQMDIPTPRASFVDLYVNNVHLGLYTQVEPIDKTFLARHFPNPNGNLYKPQIGAATLNWTQDDVKDNQQTQPNPQQQASSDHLAINIGGSRLSDLLRLLERENPNAKSEDTGQNPMGPGGFFPGGGFGPPPSQGQRQGNAGGFFPGPRGQFPFDPNMMAMGINRGFPNQNRPLPFNTEDLLTSDPNEFLQRMDQPFAFGFGGFGRPGGFGGGDSGGPPGGQGGPGGGPAGRMEGGFGFGFGRRNLLDNMALKTNENYQDHTALFRLLDVLNKCPEESFPAEIEKVLHVDQVLRYLAVSVIMVHLDNYIGMGHNYYLYEINGYFTILPWDLNMAFGTFRMGSFQQEISDFYIDEPVTNSMESRPLVNRLLAHKPYLDLYHQYLEQLLAGGFSEGAIETRIDKWADMIRPYVEKDELKFFTMEDFEKGLHEGFSEADRRPPGIIRPAGFQISPTSEGPADVPAEAQFLFGTEPSASQQAAQQREVPDDMPSDLQFLFAADPPATRPSSQQMEIPEDMPSDLKFLFSTGEPAQTENRQMPFGGGFGRRGPGGPGGPGMSAPGLKSFISKRRISVRGQLDGALPSKPTAEQKQQLNQGWPMMPGPGGMR
ncbi:MAG: CotH kinase family protein [Sedimentisphaerales bacterium]|nr:CotH kinase family protein [Sedimentisphaerales bacterium]